MKKPKLKAPARRKTAPKPKAPAMPVLIDFPQEAERVGPGHYAIRVTAPAAVAAELSIDGKDWQPCRESVGFWWFDWSPEPLGRRVIEARAKKTAKGRWVKSGARSFEVAA